MEFSLLARMNERLYLRDPEQSDLGRRIIKQSVELIVELGFEELTFKKLASHLCTAEASIYRYFENKHRLLVYLIDWYWHWMAYRLDYETHSMTDVQAKLEVVIQLLLLQQKDELPVANGIDIRALHTIVVREASKAYLTRHVKEDNQLKLFQPYKDFCLTIAKLINEYSPAYPYARSLASTLVEMAHYQTFFMQHLPSLTDFGGLPSARQPYSFLHHLLFEPLNRRLQAV